MHRQRKKDLNLKINRSLDKRSSRGMIFENEELRLRTISINEEVDRSQNDVKKLKKENEHLKREIWSLRDEYEKLEDMLKKVCIQANYDHSEFQPLSNYRPGRRISIGGETLFSSAYNSEDEDDGASNILMIDEDGASVGDGSQDPLLPLAVPEDSTFENLDRPNVPMYQNQHRMQMWSHQQHHSAELEVVREESENNSNSFNNNSLCDTPSPLAPISLDIEVSGNRLECNENRNYILSSPACSPPLIEITPASSPVPQYTNGNLPNDEYGIKSGVTFGNEIQDIGCVTVVPKLFQVTSELRISSSEDRCQTEENNTATSPVTDKVVPSTSANEKSSGLPPPSPGTKIKSSIITKAKHRKSGISKPGFTKKPISDAALAATVNVQCENQPQTQTMCRKHCPRRSSLVFLRGKSTIGGGSGSGSPILGLTDCCPDFHSCYQSEPSLNSVGSPQDEYFCASPIVVSTGFNGFDQSVCLCHMSPLPHRQQQGQPNWNSIDKNVAIGSVPEDSIELAAQEVIDELEKHFDPTLENIAGVRMMPGRIFICLRSGDAVKRILEKESITIKGQIIKLFDASKRFSTIVLSGTPPDLSDFTIISTLNQFGQVVAPLERRIYKGVDISERICHMHLVKNLQPVLSIGGYEVRAKIVSQCQELPLFDENEKQELPTTNASNTPVLAKTVETTSKNTSPRILRAPRLFRSSQTAPDPTVNQNQVKTPAPNQQTQKVSANDPPATEENHRFSLPLPPKAHIPILQSNSTPAHFQSQCQTLKGHSQIVRSVSSAPRLESVSDHAPENSPGSLKATIAAKRHMSISGAEGTTLSEANSVPMNLGVNNNLPLHPKKPLSRLLKSSPGSLFPQNVTGIRRGSNASIQIQQNSGNLDSQPSPTGEPANINTPGVFQRQTSNNRSRSIFPHNQSQISHQSTIPMRRPGLERSYKKEPLPWCGCWGNGCI